MIEIVPCNLDRTRHNDDHLRLWVRELKFPKGVVGPLYSAVAATTEI